MRALFGELMGKKTGVCGGRGGSQHLQWKNFYSNGVQGGIVPIATGMALAEKWLGRSGISICFLGDGTLGQGVVYESLNIAALWSAPILYVLENNKIAQTTPIEKSMAGSISARFQAFGIEVLEMDTSDALEIALEAGRLMEEIRSESTPRVLILHTHRFGPHSKGDDTRSPETVETLKLNRDPIKILAARLDKDVQNVIDFEVRRKVKVAFENALGDPAAKSFNSSPPIIRKKLSAKKIPKSASHNQSVMISDSKIGRRNVLSAINQGLHKAFETDPTVVMLGEDILDPYGGAFKVTKGLSSGFPNRVLGTPISEAGIVGVAAGMAMRGLRPVVEIMFGDFLTLAADQLINHIAKFRWMYNDQVRVPIVIRTPMGGRRGYGPTHSQTLEKHFLGVPGLKVLAPSDLGDPGALLLDAIQDEDPVLLIENKLLYTQTIQENYMLLEFDLEEFNPERGTPWYSLRVKGAPPPTLTMVAYGYMGTLAREAILHLAFEYEIFVELIVLTQLAPFELAAVAASAKSTGRILVIEEGSRTLGWGAEVLSQLSEALGPILTKARRLAALDLPVPSAIDLENDVLPGVDNIVELIRSMI
jgi:2-oxoisovalerate dehydrogenase E1 component